MKNKAVDIVVPTYNAETTIVKTLESLKKQTYPIGRVIIIDNRSTDQTIERIKDYIKTSRVSISHHIQKNNNGVGASFNRGVNLAKSDIVILMHSDSALKSKKELERLVAPLLENVDTIASFPTLLLPENVWDAFSFWQKCLLVRAVDVENPAFTGKFDAIRRKDFRAIGGFDTKHFGHAITVGGEDADLFMRLQKRGRIAHSKARVVHLHSLDPGYTLSQWIANRKLLARSYGRIARLHGMALPMNRTGIGRFIPLGLLILFLKPLLALLPFLPGMNILGLAILMGYAVYNSKALYLRPSAHTDARIFSVPFIDIFLVYYESFWMLTAFLFIEEDV